MLGRFEKEKDVSLTGQVILNTPPKTTKLKEGKGESDVMLYRPKRKGRNALKYGAKRYDIIQ